MMWRLVLEGGGVGRGGLQPLKCPPPVLSLPCPIISRSVHVTSKDENRELGAALYQVLSILPVREETTIKCSAEVVGVRGGGARRHL